MGLEKDLHEISGVQQWDNILCAKHNGRARVRTFGERTAYGMAGIANNRKLELVFIPGGMSTQRFIQNVTSASFFEKTGKSIYSTLQWTTSYCMCYFRLFGSFRIKWSTVISSKSKEH